MVCVAKFKLLREPTRMIIRRVKQLKVLKQMYHRIQDTRKDHPYGVLRIMWVELIFVMCEF